MNEETETSTEDVLDDSRPLKTPEKPPITIKKRLVYAGIFSMLVIMGFIVVMAGLINENSQCTSNPFVYGASKIETIRGGPALPLCGCTINDDILCECSLINNGGFWFDDKQIYTEDPFSNLQSLN